VTTAAGASSKLDAAASNGSVSRPKWAVDVRSSRSQMAACGRETKGANGLLSALMPNASDLPLPASRPPVHFLSRMPRYHFLRSSSTTLSASFQASPLMRVISWVHTRSRARVPLSSSKADIHRKLQAFAAHEFGSATWTPSDTFEPKVIASEDRLATYSCGDDTAREPPDAPRSARS
jgi:hypothetical protein